MHNPIIITQKTAMSFLLFVLPFCIGIAATIATQDNMMLFDTIDKPPSTPARYVFPIAWTCLYLLMGAAAAIAFSKTETTGDKVMLISAFVIQLILNFRWSILFFNNRSFYRAFFCLILMQAFIIASTVTFAKHSAAAAFLMIPLILWVTYAGFLNYMIALMN